MIIASEASPHRSELCYRWGRVIVPKILSGVERKTCEAVRRTAQGNTTRVLTVLSD